MTHRTQVQWQQAIADGHTELSYAQWAMARAITPFEPDYAAEAVDEVFGSGTYAQLQQDQAGFELGVMLNANIGAICHLEVLVPKEHTESEARQLAYLLRASVDPEGYEPESGC